MTKLTRQELEKEVERFKKHVITPIPTGIEDYKKNEFVQKILTQDVDFISSALIAWLARAELEKNSKDFVVNNNIKSSRDNKIIEFIASTMTTEQFKGFCFGNAMKYCLRLSSGEDSVKEDIAKVNQFKLIFENKKHLCAD
ncbi:DUF3310 domain-containing protein [Gilliamella sp. ESL0254]|uniref:DUF3310 domain-containing protein n=1 Tax=Gilliamella sp. ESL0254 TaxID=2705035 RepID=UPI001580EFA3|nr:DUF3310 domain-containing protein [Gilliamella sp. ESL0254]NUF26887.1 DUF3310 domain-containing protein [Gilliamella sp. ESL0254]